ncbi:MAG: hypothetical protein AAFV80_13185 [Bacteroidota bacterium]
MKKVALLSALFFCAVLATAQSAYADNWAMLNEVNSTVDARVEKATSFLVTKLSLEADQIAQISKIQKEAAENVDAIIGLKASDKEKFAAKELNVINHMDRQIFSILKEKQAVSYKRVLAERQSNSKLDAIQQRQQKAKLQQAFDKN